MCDGGHITGVSSTRASLWCRNAPSPAGSNLTCDMRYRIAFAKRFESDGREAPVDPSFALDSSLSDGVVAEKSLVGRLEPQAQHSQVLDEDDAFLGSASPEIWEYEVMDNRVAEFEQGLRESGGVLEYQLVDETATSSDDVTDEIRSNDSDSAESAGPAAPPTGDPSAGGL